MLYKVSIVEQKFLGSKLDRQLTYDIYNLINVVGTVNITSKLWRK